MVTMNIIEGKRTFSSGNFFILYICVSISLFIIYFYINRIESTGEDEEKCPLCCEGSMKELPTDELAIKEEILPDLCEDSIEQPWGNGDLDADDYDEYDDDENSYLQPKKRGRPRGSSRSSKRNYPWDDLVCVNCHFLLYIF